MKILELNLKAFGPFANQRIDFLGGQLGLHLVYGPNEAGKSSSLRGIVNFLFGFPKSTADAHKHSYSKLRIGGRLRHSDGSELNAIRRKQGKTLRCSNDKEVIEEQQIQKFLGEVDQVLFTQMFGIDHDRLRSGGDEIGNVDSEIGKLLFSASSGIQHLQQLQKDLQNEINGLLTSSRRSGAISRNIQNYLDHRKSANTATVTVETWKRHEQALKKANSKKQELDKNIQEIERELERLTRIQNSASPIGRWKLRTESLQQLQYIPRLPDDFDQIVRQALIDIRTTESQVLDSKSELNRIEELLETLSVPTELLAEFETIDALRDRFGSYRNSLTDRPSVVAKLQSFEREAKEYLRELDREPDLSIVEDLRLPIDKALRIQELGRKHEAMFERLQAGRSICDKLRQEIKRDESKLKSVSVSAELTVLRATLRSVQQKGDLETELIGSENELQRLQQQTELAIRQLPVWNGELTELASLPVPTTITVGHFDDEFDQSKQQITTLTQRLDEATKRRDAIEQELIELESGQSVPTPQMLDHWRGLRQQGWQLVSAEWQNGVVEKEQVADFLREFPAIKDLATAYQHCVSETDRVADLLRNDAQRVAMKSKLDADLRRSFAQEQDLSQKLESARKAFESLDNRWLELWAPMGIRPATPGEMQGWLHKHESICKSSQAIFDKQQQCEQQRQTIAALLQRLLNATRTIAPQANLMGKSLQELAEYLSERIDELQSSANRHQQLLENLETSREELAAAQIQFERTSNEMEVLRSDWTAEMRVLGLETNALPSQANSRLASIGSLFEKYKEVDRYRSRLANIDRDAQQFEFDVQKLIGRVAPDLSKESTETAFLSMLHRFQAARSLAEKKRNLLDQHAEVSRKLQAANDKSRQTRITLDEMSAQANVTEHEQLNQAVQQSRERQELETAVRELEDEIAGYCSGKALKDFIAEVDLELAVADPLGLRIQQRQQDLQALKDERDIVISEVTSAQIEMKQFDGSDLAAENNLQCESIAAQLEDQLQSLAVLQVSKAMLNAAIEQHREKNQGPILGRAKRIFREITLGKFADLQVDYDEKGLPVLAGIRGSAREPARDPKPSRELLFSEDTDEDFANPGESVKVSGMSDGTRDQLYLALRLASIESWLDRHEPIPFIIDDVLVNFDDARSAATLKVLAELSRRTQVIFFTHHQHLVDLAKNCLSTDDLFVTTIDEDYS